MVPMVLNPNGIEPTFLELDSHQPKRRIMRRPRTSILSIVVYIFEIEKSDETRYETTNKTINFRMEYNLTLFSIPKILKFDFIFALENFKIRLYFRFWILKNSTLFSLSNILKFDHIFAFEYFKIRLYFRFRKF